MTLKKTTLLDGHELRGEGRVWDYGRWINGTGRATCGCGEKSPELPSTNQRKQWHRDHKDAVRAQQDQEGARRALEQLLGGPAKQPQGGAS